MLTKVDVTTFASYKWGFEQGFKEGLEIARKKVNGLQGIEDIARQLLPVMDNQHIAEITELSLEEVQQMRDLASEDES